MKNSNKAYMELKNKIESKEKENKLRDFILDYPQILLEGTKYLYVKKEMLMSQGRSDIVFVVVELNDKTGKYDLEKMYVWECKKSNTYPCVIKKNRAYPSKDLISAETQLLDYVYSKKNDNPPVVPGGIIIGEDTYFLKKTSFLKKDIEENNYKEKLAKHFIDARIKFFYSSNNIRLLSWSSILNMISIYDNDTNCLQNSMIK